MREAAFSVDSQRQSWGEFLRSLRRRRVQIGLAACVIAGVGAGALVAAVSIDTQTVYALGIAALVAMGAIVAYLRTYELKRTVQFEEIRRQNDAMAELHRSIAQLQRSMAETEKAASQLRTAGSLIRQQSDLVAERRGQLEEKQVVGEQPDELEGGYLTIWKFRNDITGLLKKYEDVDLPASEQHVWVAVLALSLYEAGLDEMIKVEQAGNR